MDFLSPDEAIESLAGHGQAGVTLACDSPLLPDQTREEETITPVLNTTSINYQVAWGLGEMLTQYS